ncbi:peptidylprolyl isomerase [bacterium]|nr:peptidylprolyl isomerase [bacterium]
MQRIFILGAIVLGVLIAGCGNKGPLFPAKLEEGTPIYEFYQRLAEIDPLADPETDVLLVETDAFDLTAKNTLPILYQDIFNYTRGDVDKFISQTPDNIRLFIKEGTQRIAETKLMYVAARKAGFAAEKDSVDHYIEQMMADSGGEERFLKNIKKRHLTLDDVRRDVIEDLTMKSYLKNELFKDIQVSDEVVMAEYGKDKKATIRHIMLITRGKSEAEKKTAKTSINRILKKARAGSDFGKLAKRYSDDVASKKDGGLIRNVERGDLMPELDAAIFSLDVGEVSDVVETAVGYHLVQMEEREQDPRPLEIAKAEIIEELTAPAKDEAIAKRLAELKVEYGMKIPVLD